MSEYRRRFEPGATYFFTVVTAGRRPIFGDDRARRLLRSAFLDTLAWRPFDLWAAVLLPDHLHCIWILPPGDADFSTRWSNLKRTFSKRWLNAGGLSVGLSESQARRRELGVWQRRFWEHLIQSERELYAYRDYIHLNPVKHGYVDDPQAWPWSSVHRHISRGWLAADWTADPAIRIDPRGEV